MSRIKQKLNSKSGRKAVCAALGGSFAVVLSMFATWVGHPLPTGGEGALATFLATWCTYVNTEAD